MYWSVITNMITKAENVKVYIYKTFGTIWQKRAEILTYLAYFVVILGVIVLSILNISVSCKPDLRKEE